MTAASAESKYAIGASETGFTGLGYVSAGNKRAEGPTVTPGPATIVIDEDNKPVGPGQVGRLAKGGHIPLGYYKDPVKTAALFAEVDGVRYAPIEAGLDSRKGANAWLTVALQEGRNREIRRVMEYLGLTVNRLIRVSYGPFQLGALPTGAVEEVNAKVMREQLGVKEEAPPRRRASPRPDQG